MQDLITSPKRTSYSLEPVSPSSYTVNIGDTIAPPQARLMANGAAVEVRFDAEVTTGTALQKLADGRLFVTGPGDAVVRVVPRSTGITSDTALHIEFTLHGAVPRLASGGPDTLYSVNDTVQLLATPVTRSNAPITTTIPVTWTLQSGGANVQLLDATSGRVRALGNGDAVLKATSDTATLTKTVYVRQRATTTTPLGSPLTLHATGQQRQLGTQARDARLNDVSGGSYTWTSRDAGVATVSATGLVQAVAAGSTRVVVTASGPGGATATAKDSVTVTVAPARLRAEAGNWDGIASIGTVLPAPFVVQLVDAQGSVVRDSGLVITFQVFTGDATFGGQPSTAVRTDTAGRAQATLTLGVILDYDSARASGAGLAGSPVPFVARAAQPRRVTFQQQPSNTVAGAVIQPSPRVAVRDTFGTVVTSAPGLVRVRLVPGTGTAGAQLLGDSTATLSNGTATFANLTPDRVGAGYRLMPDFGTCCVPDTSQAFSVASGAAAKLAFTVQPASGFAAQVMSPAIQVAVEDAFGNQVTNFVGDVTMSVGTVPLNGSSQLFGTTQVAATNGVAGFTDLVIQQPASGYRLRAAAPGLPSLLSQYFDLRGAPANILAVSGNNQNGLVGTALSPFVVKVTDAGGTAVPGDSVIFKVTAGGGKLSGQDTVIVLTDASGQASTTLTLGSSTGTNTVTARSKSIAAAALTFTASATSANLHLAFVTQPSNATGGAAIAPAVQVAVQDASNNTVTTATTIVTLAIAGGTGTSGATLGGTVQVAAVNGVVTFTNVAVDKVGTGYQLTASANAVTGATSTAFNVTLGPSIKVGFTVQPVNGTAGATLQSFSVAVQDAGGNTVTGYVGHMLVAIGGGTGAAGAQLRGATDVNFSNGVATFTTLSVDSASAVNYRLVAHEGNTALTPDTSAPFLIVPAPPSRLAFSVQPSSVTAGVAIAPAVVVLVQDSLGNTATSAANAVTLAIASGPGGSVLSGTTSVTATAGVATFSSVRLRTAGTYTLSAAASGLAGATSGQFTVSPAPAIRLAFTVQPSDAAPGATVSPAVQVSVLDSLGNVSTSATTAVTMQITGGTGTGGASLGGTTQVSAVAGVATFSNLSISTAGNNYTLTASASGGIQSAVSSQFSIVTVSSNRLVFTVQPASVAAGAAISPAVQVTVKDGSNNTVTSFAGNVTVAITTGTSGAAFRPGVTATVAASSGVATFSGLRIDSAGTNYTLTATASGLASGVSTAFAVTSAPPNRLAFLVQPSSRTAGSVFSPAIQVAVLDSVGNRTTNATTSITLAITSGTGTSGATLAGTTTQSTASGTGVASFADLHIDKAGVGYTLTATASGTTSAVSSTFSITAASLYRVVVTPSGVTIAVSSGVQQFTATGQDSLGNTVIGLGFTWASFNTNVATVGSSTGLATAVSSGQATISVTTGGVTGYALITVAIPGATPVNLWAPMTSGTALTLYAVWGGSGSDVFAVGDGGTILHFNGSSWSAMASGTNQFVYGVWGTSGSDVFASSGNGAILHYNGVNWSAMPGGFGQSAIAVWGTSGVDCYAVGGVQGPIARYNGSSWTAMTQGAGSGLEGVWGTSASNIFAVGVSGTILHYDGASWSPMTSGTNLDLRGVWGTSGSDVYAVGQGGTILRYNGTSWSAMTSGTTSLLYKIWGSSGADIYAVSVDGTILRYNGTNWSTMQNGTSSNQLVGIWGTSAGDVFAVGSGGVIFRGVRGATVTLAPASPTLAALGATQQLTATAKDASNNTISGLSNTSYTWTSRNPSVATVSSSGLVTAVANGTARIVAVAPGGAADSTTVTVSQVASTITVSPAAASLASQGGTTTLTATAKDANGNTISGASITWASLNTNVATVNSSSGVVTAVASGQVTISATSGSATGYALVTVAIPGAAPANLWAAMASGTTQDLYGVWGTRSSDIFAVGPSGTILHYDGASWGAMTSGSTATLYGVWGSSGSDVFAVSGSAILHYNGTGWSGMTSGTTASLLGVWGTSGSDVYAVGTGGTILHYNGASWSGMTSGTTADLRGVWGTSGSDIHAVGQNVTLHYDGTSWTAIPSGAAYSLQGVWGTSSSDVYAVGNSTILHYDLTTWSSMSGAPIALLYGVQGTSNSDIYAVGLSSTIQHYNGTTWSSASAPTGVYYGVWGTSSSDMYVVARGGTILRGVRGATVSLTPATPTITALGATQQLTATAKDASNTTVSGVTFTWSSNNTAVATVDASTGVATAVSNGTATITATAPGGAAGSTTVTVSQVASTITVSPAGASLASQGGTTTLTATAKDANGNTISGATITWASLNTNVATVNSSTGVVTAVASGQVTISATSGSATGYALATVAIAGATPVNLWVPDSSGTTSTLNGVWGTSPTNVFTVGSSAVLRYNGSAWSVNDASFGASGTDVWGTAASDVFRASGNTVRHYDGSIWTQQLSSSTNTFSGIWGSSPRDAWAVGTTLGGPSTIYHYDGSTWQTQAVPTTTSLNGVFGFSASEVYAVGQSGTVLRYDGSTWSTFSSPSNEALFDVWGSSGSDLFVSGNFGVYRYNGSTWSSVIGPTGLLYGVWGSSGSDVYAVGGSGTIYRYNGSGQTAMTSGTTNSLQDAWGIGSSTLLAVGLSGTILRGYRGATVTVTPGSSRPLVPTQTVQLTATATDAQSNVISGLSNSSYTWTTSDASVATVSSSGLVTMQGFGTATITATAPGGAAGTATVSTLP